MPEANKITKDDPKVELDTSGPEVDVVVPEEKTEEVLETTEQETKEVEVKEESVKEIKKEQKDEQGNVIDIGQGSSKT